MISYEEWRIAYAKQALADLLARERLLQHADVPDCQQLHFLQMACEKLCKAYLCGQGVDPETLRGSHAYNQRPSAHHRTSAVRTGDPEGQRRPHLGHEGASLSRPQD